MSDKPWHKKYTVWLVIVFVALFIWGLSREARAGEVLLGLGGGVTNGNDWIGQQMTLTDRDWYLSAMKAGGDLEQPDTWRFSVGYRVDWRTDRGFAPFLRMGVAHWLDEPLPLISDRLTYDMGIGVRLWDVVELEWQHNSTAGRSLFNKGNDMPFILLVFSF